MRQLFQTKDARTGGLFPTSGQGLSLIPVAGDYAATTTMAAVIPIAATFSKLKVDVDVAPGVGKSWTVAVLKNGVATSISIAITDLNTSGQDLINTATFAAGDLFTYRFTAASSPASGQWRLSMESETGTLDTDYMWPGTHRLALDNASTSYLPIASGGIDSGSESASRNVMAASGTIRDIYLDLNAAPGSGKSFTFSVMKNNVEEASSIIAIADLATTGNLTGLAITFVAGDTLSIKCIPSGTPTAARLRSGIAVRSNVANEWCVCSTSTTTLSATVVNFMQLAGSQPPNATESFRQFALQPYAYLYKNMIIRLDGTPGVGKSYLFNFRDNSVTGSQTVTIADANTSGQDNVGQDLTITTSLPDVMVTPSGTPTTRRFSLGFVQKAAPASFTGVSQLIITF